MELCPTIALVIGPPANEQKTMKAKRHAAANVHRSPRIRRSVSRHGPSGAATVARVIVVSKVAKAPATT